MRYIPATLEPMNPIELADRLTQRADVLLDQIGIKPRPNPCYLTDGTEISIIFKNFGPTRANDVRTTVDLSMPGVTKKAHVAAPPMPASVVAAGDQLTVTFPPLGMAFESAVLAKASKGDIPLRFDATVEYTDVFGTRHHTAYGGIYYGPAGSFVVDNNHDAS